MRGHGSEASSSRGDPLVDGSTVLLSPHAESSARLATLRLSTLSCMIRPTSSGLLDNSQLDFVSDERSPQRLQFRSWAFHRRHCDLAGYRGTTWKWVHGRSFSAIFTWLAILLTGLGKMYFVFVCLFAFPAPVASCTGVYLFACCAVSRAPKTRSSWSLCNFPDVSTVCLSHSPMPKKLLLLLLLLRGRIQM